MIEILAQIDCPPRDGSPGFNCGIVLQDNRVVAAAPVVGYMARKRWSRDRVRRYCAEKGWMITVVHQLERQP